MKPPRSRHKCLNCKELFLPDYRSGQRQCYCLKPECRKARKRELMRAWLAKPENQNYFRDTKNAERVRDWQKEHPGYWKNILIALLRDLHLGFGHEDVPVPGLVFRHVRGRLDELAVLRAGSQTALTTLTPSGPDGAEMH